MTDQYLMERGPATMNVTPDKLQEYLAQGWTVLKTPAENKHVVVEQPADTSDEQLAVSKEAVSVETEEQEDAPVSVEEAVEKIGKRSRSKSKKA